MTSRKPQAVVIEDVGYVRERIREQLENLEFEVQAVEDLHQRLNVTALQRAPYVVIVSDLVDSARAATRSSIEQIARKDIQRRIEALKRLKKAVEPTEMFVYVYSKAPSILELSKDSRERTVLRDLIDRLTEAGIPLKRIIGKMGPPVGPNMSDSLEYLKNEIRAATDREDRRRADARGTLGNHDR